MQHYQNIIVPSIIPHLLPILFCTLYLNVLLYTQFLQVFTISQLVPSSTS